MKNIRKSEKRRTVNRARVSALRTQIRKLRALVKDRNATGATQELQRTVSIIDRSLRKGVLHRNTAARYKSRLTRAVRSLASSRA